MGLLRRHRASEASADRPPPDGLSMKVDSAFFVGIASPSKPNLIVAALARRTPGTILTGELVGEGTLKAGDVVICAAGRFPIKRIEGFKQDLEHVEPPQAVGLVLGPEVDKLLFPRGEDLRFAR